MLLHPIDLLHSTYESVSGKYHIHTSFTFLFLFIYVTMLIVFPTGRKRVEENREREVNKSDTINCTVCIMCFGGMTILL